MSKRNACIEYIITARIGEWREKDAAYACLDRLLSMSVATTGNGFLNPQHGDFECTAHHGRVGRIFHMACMGIAKVISKFGNNGFAQISGKPVSKSLGQLPDEQSRHPLPHKIGKFLIRKFHDFFPSFRIKRESQGKDKGAKL